MFTAENLPPPAGALNALSAMNKQKMFTPQGKLHSPLWVFYS